jgi:uncharacterized protein
MFDIGMVDKVLTDLKNVDGIEACAVVSREGLLIRSISQKEQFAESIAALSSTMLGAAEIVTIELGKGTPDRIIVETEQGRLIAVSAAPKALLVVIVNSDIGLGLILFELKEAAKKLKELFA